MANTKQDLSAATFCISIVDKHSPLAYAIINDIHWDNKVAQHSGSEMVWRYVLKKNLYRGSSIRCQKHQKIMSKVQIRRRENYWHHHGSCIRVQFENCTSILHNSG